jgi:hypothetical protein
MNQDCVQESIMVWLRHRDITSRVRQPPDRTFAQMGQKITKFNIGMNKYNMLYETIDLTKARTLFNVKINCSQINFFAW